jgi:opacity protein-like surface antigen
MSKPVRLLSNILLVFLIDHRRRLPMFRTLIIGAAFVLASTAAAHAQEWYAGGSIGILTQNDSNNSGSTGAFNSGNGAPAVPNGTAVAAGTPYGWTTEFESGMSASAEVGMRYGGGLRSGIELAYTKSDVERHAGVTLGGTNIDGVDAAVLTGSATKLGATVGQIVNDGQGDISNTSLFANLYYDFNLGGAFEPYVGAGIGFAQVDVDYSPSGVGIINGDDTAFAWQLKGGVTWKMDQNWEAYGEYAYRQTDDITLDNKLFPGTLNIENTQSVFSVGVRFKFN